MIVRPFQRRLRPDAATSHRVSLCVYAAGDCGGVCAIGVVAWIFVFCHMDTLLLGLILLVDLIIAEKDTLRI